MPERKETARHWLARAERIATRMAHRVAGSRRSPSSLRAALAVIVVALVAMLGAGPAAAQLTTFTSTTVTGAPNPSTFGQTVTFTATVGPVLAPPAAAGTVTFRDGGTTLGTVAVNSGGVATATATFSISSDGRDAYHHGDV